MVDGGFEHCDKGQAEYCQSNRNPMTSPLRSNCLSFPKIASPLEQGVAGGLSQQKSQRAATGDHDVIRVTLGEACKRAVYVATNGRRLELLRCHSQYHRSLRSAKRDVSAMRQAQGTPLWLVLWLF